MRATLACVVGVFAACFSWAGSENARPTPQLERLMKVFSGRWSIAITVEPNVHTPKGGTKGARWEVNAVVAENEREDAGKHVVFKEVFSNLAENSFAQTLYQGERGSDLKRLVTIVATRKTAPQVMSGADSVPVAAATQLKMPGPTVTMRGHDFDCRRALGQNVLCGSSL